MSSSSNTVSSSSNFDTLFNTALEEYTKQTGKDLHKHPLASKINSCNSPDSILDIFQEQAEEFDEIRKGDKKLFNWLGPIIKVLHAFSTNEILKGAVSHAFPPSKTVLSAIAILLSTGKRVGDDYDALVDIFECVEISLRRFKIYTENPLTPALSEIVIKIMVEILSVLALATKQINQGKFKKFAMKFLGEKDIRSVLLRLDRLTLEESKTTVAQTLDVVYDLVKNMQVVMEDGKASTNDIQETLVLMQEMAVQVHQFERDRLKENVLRWLSAPDPWFNHNTARKARHLGTATWFTRGDTMNNWKSTGSLMWIHGLPGSGKSVLCSTIIQEVRDVCKSGLATFAFFYFDFRDADKQNVRNLLFSLLIQLSSTSDNFCKILSKLYSAHGRGSQIPSEDELLECLKEMLSLPGQGEIYIVMDALDECPNLSGFPTPREEVLIIIQELVRLRLLHLHLCILSRPEVEIQDALKHLADHNVSLHEQAGQNQDISAYIKSVVYSDPKMKRWREEDKQLAVSKLIEKAGGMFRWVYCQLEALRCYFPSSIRGALDKLPGTLDETYEQTLRGINKHKLSHAYRLFQCLVISKRPLHVEELTEFFTIRPNAETIPTFDASLRPDNPKDDLLSACSTLVAVVNANGQRIAQFSHFSVREYLISDRIAMSEHVPHFQVSQRSAHVLLVRACLSVLSQLDYRVVWDKIRDIPLASYAAEYWVDHAQFENVSSDIQHEMCRLFDRNEPHFATWLWLYNIDDSSGAFKATAHHIRPYAVPLYYAALCGFRDIAKHLIDTHPEDINARGGKHVTPLHAALETGHPNVAMLLVERGADVESRDSKSRTPLHIASYHGYSDVMSLLISRGANLNAEGDSRKSPLYLASEEGRHDAARLLLEHKADPNHPDVRGRTPLHLASERGHDKIVRLLLDHGADPNQQDDGDRSPLYPSSFEGRDEVFWSSFGHNLDANHKKNRGLTALHLASLYGHIDIIRVLLDRGAEVNLADNCGFTPLYLASLQGHNDTVQLLLDYDANANHPDNRGWTPLHRASLHGHNDVVGLLLDHDAVIDHPESRGWTPLHHASLHGHNDIVRLLLSHGAVVNYPDNRGWTPLHLASREGHDATVHLLLDQLDHGAVAECSDSRG